jgi:hypothetical protein
MKTIRLLALTILAISLSGNLLSQTADEVISKYIKAIGGKDRLTGITSVYTESTIDAMGAQGTLKTNTLNGKGLRIDVDIAGYTMTSCYTDKEGWIINTMMGISTPEKMATSQYNSAKDQITIGGPFINYADKGYKVDLLGTDSIGKVNTYKLKFTSPDTIISVYYFDANTFYLVQAVTQSEMQGQMVESVESFSDYRQADGYSIPYKMETVMGGGQFSMETIVTKVELDKPVDEVIFKKPE